MDTQQTLLAIFLIVLLTDHSGALQCFQCSGSGPISPCETDVATLTSTREDGDGQYSKNCSVENQNFCFIEYTHNRGKLTTFIRDCSDGITFDFDTIPRLVTIHPNNQTTCATYGTSGTVVCIAVCRTNFCNGPQSSGTTNVAEGCSRWRGLFASVILLVVTNAGSFAAIE